MNGVAAPLYRIFVADAHVAARAGDSARVLECIGLALDFVPEEHRERVLLAAAELVPSAGAEPRPRAAAAPFEVRISGHAGSSSRPGRITWEDRFGEVPPERVALRFAAATDVVAAHPRSRWLRGGVGMLVLAALVAFGASRWPWDGITPALFVGAPETDAVARARDALGRGDLDRVLTALAPLGDDAGPEAWLLRASVFEARKQREAAVQALSAAAARDAADGHWALAAGDRLQRIGAVGAAADAYLYAVTPSRSGEEIERIARAQETAGHVDRARRVRVAAAPRAAGASQRK